MSSCVSDVLCFSSWRIRDSWPNASVPWKPTKAYARAGGITTKDKQKQNWKTCQRLSGLGWCVSPQDYLDAVGLSAMFPRVEVFLIQGSAVEMLEKPQMDGETQERLLETHLNLWSEDRRFCSRPMGFRLCQCVLMVDKKNIFLAQTYIYIYLYL